MPEKDPATYGVITYAWVLVLASWGGAVNWFRKSKAENFSRVNIMEFIGELATSAFTGVLTFWGCEAAGFAPLWTAVLVGISGHMGSRAIFHAERVLQSWVSSRAGVPVHDEGDK